MVSYSGHFLNRRLAKEEARAGTPSEAKEEREEAKEADAAKEKEPTQAPAKEVDKVDMLEEAKEKVAEKVV